MLHKTTHPNRSKIRRSTTIAKETTQIAMTPERWNLCYRLRAHFADKAALYLLVRPALGASTQIKASLTPNRRTIG